MRNMKELLSYFEEVPTLVLNLIIITAAILLGLLIHSVVVRLLRYYADKRQTVLSHQVVDYVIRPLQLFIPVVFVNAAIPLMRLTRAETVRFDKFIEIAMTLSFAFILINLVNVFQAILFNVYDINQKDNLKARRVRTQIQYIRQVVKALIIIITLAVILMSFDSMRKLGTGLLGGVAIGATIVGFAAQQSLGNLLAGFQIAFTQPIRLGDWLVVEGEAGWVEEITLTYVVLKIWDKRRLILPINYFITKPFQNWTRRTSDLLGTVYLYMDYSVPVEEVRNELKSFVQGNPLWDEQVCGLVVTDSKEHTIELRALVSSRNSGDLFDLRCLVREHLISYIEKNYPGSLPRTRTALDNKGDDNPFKGFAYKLEDAGTAESRPSL